MFTDTRHDPMAEAVNAVIVKVIANINHALDTDAGTNARAVRKAAMAWRRLRDRIAEGVEPIVRAMLADLALIDDKTGLTPEGRRQREQTAIDKAIAAADALHAEVRTAAESITSTLLTASTPPRPADNPTTEARIAAAKTDLRMVLDPLPADPTDISRRMGELLDRATGTTTPDPYAAWVLGGSTWPADYLAARCPAQTPNEIAAFLDLAIGQVLDRAPGADYTAARRAYRAIDGTYGLPGLVSALAQVGPAIKRVAHQRPRPAYR